MPSKPRRSLRERDQEAISAGGVEQVSNIENLATTATAPPNVPKRRAAPQVRTESTTRTGLYFQEQTFNDARSAYLVDLDSQPDPATSFARWIGQVIARHNELTPERRAQVAKAVGEEPHSGMGFSRSFSIPTSTVEDMEEAIRNDRKASRYVSASQYVTEAVRHAIADARRRNGGTLPIPPARLPNKPTR